MNYMNIISPAAGKCNTHMQAGRPGRFRPALLGFRCGHLPDWRILFSFAGGDTRVIAGILRFLSIL
jgi:hypothetical protein